MLNLRTSLINQKSGNNFAVFDVYLPSVGVFTVIRARGREITYCWIQNLWYEMVYVTKLWEIHQCCGCNETMKGFNAG